jgi:hypothetical protein
MSRIEAEQPPWRLVPVSQAIHTFTFERSAVPVSCEPVTDMDMRTSKFCGVVGRLPRDYRMFGDSAGSYDPDQKCRGEITCSF